MEEIEPLLEVMREIAERRGQHRLCSSSVCDTMLIRHACVDVPVSCVGLNWIMCKGVVPLPGARNAKQAEQVNHKILVLFTVLTNMSNAHLCFAEC